MSEKRNTKRALLAGLLVAGFWLSARPADAQCASPTTVNPWRRWEHTITSLNSYANPYKNLVIKVEYTNAANPTEKYSTYAFWDGKNASNKDIFKIRAAFGSGTWNWQITSCTNNGAACSNDAPIQSSCGSFSVNNVIIGGQSPLYDHGFLQHPAGGMRHLVHSNGTPFFWLGDTAWNAMKSASASDWSSYVTARGQVNQAQPPGMFSVVQVALAPDYAAAGSGVPAPFNPVSCTGALPIDSCTQWNPAYWQQLDAKVNAANGNGIVVVLAGVMDPTDRGTAGGTGSTAYPQQADANVFARNLAARMFGNFVIFSTGFDDRTTNTTVRNLAIAVGNEIKGATSRHLITYHPGGEANQGDEPPNPQNLHNQNRISGGWLSFDMVHSGHVANASGLTQLQRALYRARVFPQRMAYDSTFNGNVILPVVNGEAAYDAGPTNTDSATSVFNTYRTRQYGYVTMLSGAYGYTFGASNIYNWTASWSTPLSWPSAAQMKHLRNIFQTVTWYRLIGNTTEHGRVENQNANEQDRMAVGYDANNALVAYVPNGNTAIELYLADITTFPGSWTKTWYSPRTGASQAATPVFLAASGTKRNRYSFTKPACDGTCPSGTNDWVLVLKKTTTFAATSAFSTEEMRLWSEPAAEEDSADLLYAMESPDRGVGQPARASSGERQVQRLPRVTPTPGGGYVAVWQSRGEGNEGEDVWVRRFLPSGRPAADEVRANGTVSGDQTLPWVSAAAAGDFVVVWAGRGPDGELSDIFAQRFDAWGRAAGDELRVNTATEGEQSFPRVASTPGGDFVVAWESEEADGTEIRVQRFDASGAQVGGEVRVSGAGLLRLAEIQIQPSGEARVVWTKLARSGESLGLFARTIDRSGSLN